MVDISQVISQERAERAAYNQGYRDGHAAAVAERQPSPPDDVVERARLAHVAVLRDKGLFDTTIGDAPVEVFREAMRAALRSAPAVGEDEWSLCEKLRASEGDSVTLISDNSDFNGQPNCAVVCCGDWTDWKEVRFTGDTMRDALRLALQQREGK